MRKVIFTVTLICIIALTPFLTAAEPIDVLIKGMDDGVKTNKQQDYLEALMNAKLQAIERAGVAIESITKVENFTLKYDMIESRAKAVLSPGFEVMDIGYLADGTYQVTLVGKVKTLEEGIETKDLRYAKSLVERGKKDEARKIIFEIINNSKDDNAKAEALYYSVVWGFTSDDREIFEKLKAYYPNFKYLKRLNSVVKEREEKEAERIRREAELIQRKVDLRRRREAERKREEEKRRKAAKKKWELWQIRMRDDFTKAQSYDKTLTPEEKNEVWSKFLSSYKADNPLSTQDEGLRRKAEEKLSFWKEYKSFGMKFVWVPGGCYEMGSNSGSSDEKPVHTVCVDGFWMGKYEVTNAQYRRYKSNHVSKNYKGYSLNGDKQPVVYVSWKDAKAYAEWLSKKSGGKYKFRLPTEAEWEYACRAGSKTARYWGDNPDDACHYANVSDKTARRNWSARTIHNCNDRYNVSAPVGSFNPNAFGLYDMLGNTWELCADIYASDEYKKHERNNPVSIKGGSVRVVRGGSWGGRPRRSRCATRAFDSSGLNNNYDVGFRLVRID